MDRTQKMLLPRLNISPPLLNSATPWATNLENLISILNSPSTGAVTTRTSLLSGFDHQPESHQYLFFNPASSRPDKGVSSTPETPANLTDDASASLNSLGYSPIPTSGYIEFIKEIARRFPKLRKTVIISVTGSPQDIRTCYTHIEDLSNTVPFPLAMEVNLSCPNIQGAPPPAYDGEALSKYFSELPKEPTLPIGIKTPPYTHNGQFCTLIAALRTVASSLSFITATNTLGSCLILESNLAGDFKPQLPSSGLGGMAGPPLHPLALGNVRTLRHLLDEAPELVHVQIIGVGGVSDGDGYRRMKNVGASAVAIGTALGRQGPAVFEKIEHEIKGIW